MKTSKELVAKAGILPKLHLGNKLPGGGVQTTGPHRVKLISDKIVRAPDMKGNQIEWVRYIVEENEVQKTYDTKLKNEKGDLSYLVQRLAEFNEGDEVILEMKKRGAKNYVDVSPLNTGEFEEVEEEVDLDSPEVPIESNEGEEEPTPFD